MQTSHSSGNSPRFGRFASNPFPPMIHSLIGRNNLGTGSDPETIDTGTIPSRYNDILDNKHLMLGGKHRIVYDMDRDMLWRWDQVLKTHPNGMRFSVFGEEGGAAGHERVFQVRLALCELRQSVLM